ncbi:family 43 glycosylhydrolase [Mollicutes bacterium LVI A0039]|nr:family 43 glycosylhydrolase [Mollicutes bacterium LVI A0039]
MKILNPILKGFNPDPTMCKAKESFFIATSTFQWYPGITIYSSHDLANWDIVSTPLTEQLGFKLLGVDDSAGIWAPNLVYENDMFYLSYTIVKSATGVYYDMENYITTSASIEGPWKVPTQVNSGCFDPSLFFDDEKLYMLAKIVDHRYEPTNSYIENYSGIIMQELNPISFQLVGEHKIVSYGTKIGGEEGPQMFKRNGYYYLNIAEGGTEFNHQTTVLRAENMNGPFEVHPQNPLLKSEPKSHLQKSGHSSFVNIGNDEWVISHLCSRPIKSTAKNIVGKECCPLGRETAIQNIKWENDWPYVVGGKAPNIQFENFNKAQVLETKSFVFDCKTLPGKEFLSLRQDISKFNHVDSKGLRMKGRDSLMSKFDVNMYAYRPKKMNFKTSIDINFQPKNYLQMSGMTLYYDTENYITIFVTHDKTYGKCIKVEAINHRKYSTLELIPIKLENDIVKLIITVDDDLINFNYQIQNQEIKTINCQYHSSYLSDDYILLQKPSFFTGMMIGFYCCDLTGGHEKSTVNNFRYEEV